jgi:hypothetical protein
MAVGVCVAMLERDAPVRGRPVLPHGACSLSLPDVIHQLRVHIVNDVDIVRSRILALVDSTYEHT